MTTETPSDIQDIEKLVTDYAMAVDLNLDRVGTRKALMSAISRVVQERDAARRRASEWCPECEGTGRVKYHDDHTEGCQTCASFRAALAEVGQMEGKL